MSRAALTDCWECGRPSPGGVCMGPHPEFALRGGAGGVLGLVTLPDWWDRPVEAPGADEQPQAVTTSEPYLHIRYDRGAQEKRLAELKRRLAEEREREAELRELYRLAEKYGMVLRPRLGSPSARVEVEHVVRSSAAPSPLGGGELHEYPGEGRGASVVDRPRREGEKRIPRRAHNPETAGSTPVLATKEPVGVR